MPRAATFSPTHFDEPPDSEDELLKLITLGQNPSPSEPDAAADNLPSSYPYHLQAHDVHSSVGGEEDIEHKFNEDPSSSDDYDIDLDIDVGDEGHDLGSLDAWEFHNIIQATHDSLQAQLVDPTLNQDTQSMLLHQLKENSKHLRTVKKTKAQPHSKPSKPSTSENPTVQSSFLDSLLPQHSKLSKTDNELLSSKQEELWLWLDGFCKE